MQLQDAVSQVHEPRREGEAPRFWKILEEARAVAPSREDFLGETDGASKYVSFGCEAGDQEPARLLTLRKYYSIGIPVLAYTSYSETTQHLLCELHGSRKALSCGLWAGAF